MQQFARWHQTKPGLVLSGAVELALAYWLAGLAIDRGSWWWYALTLVFLVGGLQNCAKLVGNLFHGKAGRTR